MNDDYTKQRKSEIARWESRQQGVVAKSVAELSKGILWLPKRAGQLLIPNKVQLKVADRIERTLCKLNNGVADYFVNATEIRGRVEQARNDVGHALKAADTTARHYWNWHLGYAAAEGGAMGAVGLFGLAADVPALTTIALRVIYQIAACYGYDIQNEREREYALNVLQTGSAADLEAKAAFLAELKKIEETLVKVTWKKMAESLAKGEVGHEAALAAIRAFAKQLGIQLTKRKALQIVPVVGAAAGASFNAVFINDIGRAAYNSYGRRWIADRDGSNRLPPPDG